MKKIFTLLFTSGFAVGCFAQGASPVLVSTTAPAMPTTKTMKPSMPTIPPAMTGTMGNTAMMGGNKMPQAQNQIIQKPAAILEDVLALKETMFNFGKIPQGKPVTHIFTVTNTGKTGFKLDNVQASCGCTTPQWNKDEIVAPGKNAEITVGYNAAAAGTFNKSITITYNGGQSKVLNITGEVWTTPAASAPANDAVNDLKN